VAAFRILTRTIGGTGTAGGAVLGGASVDMLGASRLRVPKYLAARICVRARARGARP
jgi:hypothetical protein